VPTSDPIAAEAISNSLDADPKTIGSLQADDEHNSNFVTVVLYDVGVAVAANTKLGTSINIIYRTFKFDIMYLFLQLQRH
jgi:hypothetical protein